MDQRANNDKKPEGDIRVRDEGVHGKRHPLEEPVAAPTSGPGLPINRDERSLKPM